jgi:alpha-ketoglutarate-dependent taurine dioxygenase
MFKEEFQRSAMVASRDLGLRRLTTAVGAVIEGVDLRSPLTRAAADFIYQALLAHGVVFFQGQEIDKAQYWAFMRNFGMPQKDEATGTDHDRPEEVQSADMAPVRHSTAVWHADTTSLARPPKATALRAVSPPSSGGDTCWSSMYAAYEALSEPMRQMLAGMSAVHSVQPTFDRMKGYAQYYAANYLPRHDREQIHPVVLVHPESGRKALYINESFTTRIVELTPAESASVLSLLFRHVEKPDFCMRWHWTANDIALWDNRSVQHYAVPDYTTRRVMERIVLAGDRPGDPESHV